MRRHQGITSSALAGPGPQQQQRRRIEDESNWLASESDTDYSSALSDDDASLDDEEAQRTPRLARDGQPLSFQSKQHSRKVKSSRPQAPLTTFITNAWQDDKDEDSQDEKHPYYYGRSRSHHRSRRRGQNSTCFEEMMDSSGVRECLYVAWRQMTPRVMAIWAAIGIFLYFARHWLHSSHAHKPVRHNETIQNAVRLRLSGAEPRSPKGRMRTWFGAHQTAEFGNMKHMMRLNESTSWSWRTGSRLVLLGDVHGCADPLEELLSKINFRTDGMDHLAFTGDLVAKGPDSGRVLDIAISHKASCVRGNHDDKLLLLHRDLGGMLRESTRAGGDTSSGSQAVNGDGKKQQPITGKAMYGKERELARQLTDAQHAYLSSCPLILDLGTLPGLAPSALLVHAGLVPGLEIERQDAYALMNMRSIDLRTFTPLRTHAPVTQQQLLEAGLTTDERDALALLETLPGEQAQRRAQSRGAGRGQGRGDGGELDAKFVQPWAALWAEWQAMVPERNRTLVVYGHDARVGLVDETWTVGLDSACVVGNRLSALVLQMGANGSISRSIESVACGKGGTRANASRKKNDTKKKKKKEKKKTTNNNSQEEAKG